MHEDSYAGYREHLREGMRVEIGIPLSGGGVFRDWAIIGESRQDELLAQISRDVLPANVSVDIGSILDVSVWIKREVYTCSGIVTEKLGERVLRIRLFGNFTLRERRQFFRIDLTLRLKYSLPADAARRDIEKDWEHRRDVEHLRSQGYDEVVIAAQKARYRQAVQLEWHDMLLAEVNIGGGGIGVSLPEPVQPDQYLNLEIHLPLSPPRQVQAVVQVIHVTELREQKGGGVRCDAGMKFVLLDERDRDLIFRHISVTQIEYLRKVSDRRELDEPDPREDGGTVRWRQVVIRAAWTLILLALSFYLVTYFINYRQVGSSNEIQKTYEKAIRQYRQQE